VNKKSNYSKAIKVLEKQIPALKVNSQVECAKQSQSILNRLKRRIKERADGLARSQRKKQKKTAKK